MLLNNYTVLNSSPGRAIGGFTNLYSNYKTGGWYSFYDNDSNEATTVNKANLPTGTQPPYSWILAPKGGELSSTTMISGTSTLSSGISMGRAIEAALTGSGTLTSAMALVTSMSANLVGSGEITANLGSIIQMACAMAGSGSLSTSMGLLAGIASALSGSGTIAANLKGTASMSADIFVNAGTASVNELVQAIWGAIAASYNVAGTMGEKLNNAASAGDPWGTSLPGAYASGTAGNIVGNQIPAIKAKTDNLPASPASTTDIPTVSQVADQVWDEDLTTHTTANTTGKKLNKLKNPTLLIGNEIIV